MKCIIADAGYDSESNHVFAREEMALRTIIPPLHGRPTNKPARGRYRRLMQTRFDEQNYRKRTQVETVMSMIKRRQGSFCKGRTYWSRCRELHLMAITHNIMILWHITLFYRAGQATFCLASGCVAGLFEQFQKGVVTIPVKHRLTTVAAIQYSLTCVGSGARGMSKPCLPLAHIANK